MAAQYVFQAGGDACEVCAGLNGTVTDAPMGQVHENCQCQSIPVKEQRSDCPKLEISDVTQELYGPGNRSVRISAEITVSCCDGSENSESVEIDLGEADASSLDDVMAAIEPEALGLTPEDCGDGIDVWFDEDEDDGELA